VKTLPRYPVYVPSKGRYDSCFTSKCLTRDGVPHFLVINESERDLYAPLESEFCSVLLLPVEESNAAIAKGAGLIFARNWIRDHAEAAGFARHWQIDDNVRHFRRWVKDRRLPCRAGIALRACEDFSDRYTNVGISGLNYTMFAVQTSPPFYLNVHVYSISLINHAMPFRWRLRYNDDTDICLQALANDWCTVLFNVFIADKIATMVVSGGNTDQIYQGDGRLRMARDLERMWPGVVTTKRRFQRPQHCIKNSWRHFDTPLIRVENYDEVVASQGDWKERMKLKQVKPTKSSRLREFVAKTRREIR
jgi:hypothetical protein